MTRRMESSVSPCATAHGTRDPTKTTSTSAAGRKISFAAMVNSNTIVRVKMSNFSCNFEHLRPVST